MQLSDVVYLENGAQKQTISLYREVFFEDTQAFAEAYYQGKAKENKVSCLFEGTTPVSMIHWNPKTVQWRERRARSMFLVAVATKEAYRRRGLMARLMREGLTRLFEKKMPFVFLTPAKEAYYRPFGFAVVSDEIVSPGARAAAFVQHPGAEGRQYPCLFTEETEGYVCVLTRAEQILKYDSESTPESTPEYGAESCWTESFRQLAQLVNQAFSDTSDMWIYRDSDYYRKLLPALASEDGGIALIYRTAKPADRGTQRRDVLCGSFIYTMEGGVRVRDVVGMIPWRHPKVSVFFTEHTEAVFAAKTMMRILSLEQFVRGLQSEREQHYSFVYEDTLLPQNNGSYCLRITPSGGVLKHKEPKTGEKLSVCTPDSFLHLFQQKVAFTEIM